MTQASQVISSLNSILRQVTPVGRTVYMRVYTMGGGDPLTGQGQTPFSNDTILNPQPYFSRLGHVRTPGMQHIKAQEIVDSAGREFVADAWSFIVSPSAITVNQLEDPNMTFVLKDSEGNEEEMNLIDYDPTSGFGVDLLYTCYMRSIERP